MTSKLSSPSPEEGSLIDLTNFPSLYHRENVILHKIFHKYGYELRIAGGAVRDVLLGIAPKDIDYATNATPPKMNEMFSAESIRTLNRNGEAHGTVTVRINEVNFEVTTLRIDSEPDGRHTKVIFTDDWRLDAARRDLTVNSMFLSLDLDTLPKHLVDKIEDASADTSAANSQSVELQSTPVYGRLYDFFGGRNDLMNRHIRFVGDAVSRIREDYLRILRYFRFHGRLTRVQEQDVHDVDTLLAIKENCAGLSKIAGERCWVELKSILTYPSTPSLLRRMYEAGIFSHIGFPTNPNFEELDAAWSRGLYKRTWNPATCLAALLSNVEEIEALNSRLKLSNAELLILGYIVKHRKQCYSFTGMDALKHYQRELLLSREAANKIRPVITEMILYVGGDPELTASWNSWEAPKFPVHGHELQAKWAIPPRSTGTYLTVLRRRWVESDCTLTSDELLSDTNRQAVETDVSAMDAEPPLRIKPKKPRRF